MAPTETVLARLLVRRGDPASPQLVDALRATPESALYEPQTRIPLICCVALFELSRGEPRRCLDVLADQLPGDLSPEQLLYWVWDALPSAAAAMACLGGHDYDAWFDSLLVAAGPATSARKRVARALADAELASVRAQAVLPAWRALVELGDAVPAHDRAYALYRCAKAGLESTGHEPAGVDQERGEVGRDTVAAWMAESGALAAQMGAAPLLGRLTALARRNHLSQGSIPHQRGASSGSAPAEHGLTERERDVLRLVADGRTNAEIARELCISPKTASVHVSHILAELGVETRTEAAATAFREGLLEASHA